MSNWNVLYHFDKYKVDTTLYYRHTNKGYDKGIELRIENNGMTIFSGNAGEITDVRIIGRYYKDRDKPVNAAARHRMHDIHYWAYFLANPESKMHGYPRKKQFSMLSNHMYKLWRDLRKWHYRKPKYDYIEVNGEIIDG